MNFNQPYRPGGLSHMPPVTKNIIIISFILFAAKFLLASTLQINLTAILGLHDYLAPNFRPYQFVTYIFMHGDFMHIFFNMIGVYLFGQVLEEAWGSKRFLIFFILTGLGAAIVQYITVHIELVNYLNTINNFLNDPTNILSVEERAAYMDQKYAVLNGSVTVGASGSLMGMLGAFGLMYPNRLLYIYFVVPIKAKWLVIGYGLFDLVLAFQNNPGDNVAHFAHLGGLLVGVCIVLIWRKNRTHFY